MLNFDKNIKPVIIADAGSNHYGESARVIDLIHQASLTGCDAITFDAFEKGYLPQTTEQPLNEDDWEIISCYCTEKNLPFGATCWTVRSLETLKAVRFKPAFYKVPDMSSDDETLLKRLNKLGRTVILSTGMRTIGQIDIAMDILKDVQVVLLHSTNIYPCTLPEINLYAIRTMIKRYGVPVGYSSHESSHLIAAMSMGVGAMVIEKALILGDDKDSKEMHEYSITPEELGYLIKAINWGFPAMGDGKKTVYIEEMKNTLCLEK